MPLFVGEFRPFWIYTSELTFIMNIVMNRLFLLKLLLGIMWNFVGTKDTAYNV